MSQSAEDRVGALEQLREELLLGGRTAEAEALDAAIAAAKASVDAGTGTATGGARQVAPKGQAKTYLKLKKKYYTPAEVARRVGVSRQTIVKWRTNAGPSSSRSTSSLRLVADVLRRNSRVSDAAGIRPARSR